MLNYTHPQFRGIEAKYVNDLLPQLLPIELARKAFWPKFYRRAGFAVLIILGLTFLAIKHFDHFIFAIFGFMAATVAVASYYASASKSIRGDTKQILMQHICEFIGLHYVETDEMMRADISYWQGLSLLPQPIHRDHFEDFINGQVNGTHVSLCEAKLERKVKTDKGHRWDIVFRGSLITLDFHRDFLGTTLVLRDAGIFNAKKKNGMKRIGLGEPRFEKIFEAYGTDQVEGRYLLTPVFMEKLVALEESVDGEKIRFAFSHEKLLIAVEHGNRFESGSMRQTITDPARAQTIINEIEAVLAIIESVTEPKKRR